MHSVWTIYIVLCCLGVTQAIAGARRGLVSKRRSQHLLPRQPQAPPSTQQEDVQRMAQEASNELPDPVKYTDSIKKVLDEVLTFNGINQTNQGTWAKTENGLLINSSDGDEEQVPWFDGTPFKGIPNVDRGSNGGWSKIPGDIPGFTLNQSLKVTDELVNGKNVVQPFFMSPPDEYQNDPSKIKRVVIVFPGKPRDSWKYATLVYNVREFVYQQSQQGQLDGVTINPGEVMIMAPVVLNDDDLQAGGVDREQNWVAYKGSNWQMGGSTRFPNLNHSVSFYKVMDIMLETLFDRQWLPNLNQVVFVGHSMGGQTAMRYALLKKRRFYENNIKFWIGNPGSYAWLYNSRPISEPDNLKQDCSADIDTWPYGLGGNVSKITKYGRKRVQENKTEIVTNYRLRDIRYAYALLDNGSGDSHCQAQYQGYSHLHRGTLFAKALADSEAGFPVNHSVSYAAQVSHQDYPMLAQPESQQFIFVKDYNTPFHNLSHKHEHHHKATSKELGDSEDEEYDNSWEEHVYRIVGWVVVVSFIVAIIVVLLIFYMMYKANANDWDRDDWDYDSKQRLL